MKKIMFLLVLSVFLIGCTPTDAQIEAAIEQTRIAQPTNTPAPEPTSTPNVVRIEEISYDEAIDLFLSVGIPCGEKEIFDNGTYTQSCDLILDDAIIQAEINGKSSETVSSFGIGYIPFIGEDLTDEMYETFIKILLAFDNGQEMKIWLDNNFQEVISSAEPKNTYFRQADYLVTLTGETGFCLLSIRYSSD